MTFLKSHGSFKRIGLFPLCGLAALMVLLPDLASAQAAPTGSRYGGISAFSSIGLANPAYTSSQHLSYMVGADYSVYLSRNLKVALEARGNEIFGPTIRERSVLVGPRVRPRAFGRYQPYGDFLIGAGTIHFPRNSVRYTGDRSTVTSFGGGADVALSDRFKLRLDYQVQHWNLGNEHGLLRHDVIFYPSLASIGVLYRLPLGRDRD